MVMEEESSALSSSDDIDELLLESNNDIQLNSKAETLNSSSKRIKRP